MLLFEQQRFFLEISDGKEKERVKQVLVKNGGEVIDKPDKSPEEYFHVLDRSNWNRIKELQTKKVKIVGPKCIFDSINLKKRLPDAVNKHPVFCRTLEGLKVCCTSLSSSQRAETEEMVKCMNGSYSVELTSRTDYLVATEVGSPKYRVALDRGIPIVKPSWVSSCWKTQEQQPMADHLLPPFAGCIISVTNLSTSTRTSIERLVTAYGGIYCPDLTNSCTHLISPYPAGLKYKYATIWGVHVVTVYWLLDSVNAYGCLDPSKYFPNVGTQYPSTTSASWPSSVVQRYLFPCLSTNNRNQPVLRTTSTGKRGVSFANSSPNQIDHQEQSSKRQKLIEDDNHDDSGRNKGGEFGTNNIPELFGAIIDLCDEITNRAIDSSNVCALLEQSDDSTPMVRAACLNIITKDYDTIKKTKGYQQLSEELKEEVLRLQEATMKEKMK